MESKEISEQRILTQAEIEQRLNLNKIRKTIKESCGWENLFYELDPHMESFR